MWWVCWGEKTANDSTLQAFKPSIVMNHMSELVFSFWQKHETLYFYAKYRYGAAAVQTLLQFVFKVFAQLSALYMSFQVLTLSKSLSHFYLENILYT